jgi:hypothetical protein
MADINQIKLQQQLDFLNLAVDQGVDAAVQQYGAVLTAGEALALKDLSQQELVQLRDINAKIAGARRVGGVLAEDDWTCVNVVC